jgi:hypothetical protein
MDANQITYRIVCGTRIIGVFETLMYARRFAEGIVGHTVTIWDSMNAYYGMWYSKEGWIR